MLELSISREIKQNDLLLMLLIFSPLATFKDVREHARWDAHLLSAEDLGCRTTPLFPLPTSLHASAEYETPLNSTLDM
jgi:hypothetical protein